MTLRREKLTRRTFVRQAAATALGLSAVGPAAAQEKSKVVSVKRDDVFVAGRVNEAALAGMLGEGLVAFTAAATVAEAWAGLFRPDDVVGLKVNGRFGPGAVTHPELIAAVVEGVKSAGVKPSNIIIRDMLTSDLVKGRYPLNRGGEGVQCYATDDDYEPQAVQQGAWRGRVSKILTQQITALVNMPVLKDHVVTGLTFALKNHFGSIDNPSTYHKDHGDPYIADVNCLPAIREKTRVVICDALLCVADRGPGRSPAHAWEHKALMFGKDPVALDYVGWQIIERRRRETGLPSLAQAGREPRYVASAAERGLGTDDPDEIELVDV